MLGGGRSHVALLRELARERIAAAEVMLVSPRPTLLHPAMLPGLVAGRHEAAACTLALALAPLAQAAGVRFVEGQATALNAAQRIVTLADGRAAEYDLLSIATGQAPRRDMLPGAAGQALFARPAAAFVQLLPPLLDLAARRVLDIVVIGGGVTAFELALALQQRLGAPDDERARVALVTGGPEPLAGWPAGATAAAAQLLRQRRITVFREPAARIEPRAVVLQSGARLACDAPVIANEGEGPAWLAGSGLALDGQGFVATGETLQSVSHPEVFAIGEVAAGPGRSDPRAAAALAVNLRRHAGGGDLMPFAPRSRIPAVAELGDGRALAAWGSWWTMGRWAGAWKARAERRFVEGPASSRPAAEAATRSA